MVVTKACGVPCGLGSQTLSLHLDNTRRLRSYAIPLTIVCLFLGIFYARAEDTLGSSAVPAPRITFLSLAEAKEVIVDDSLDPYFTLLTPLEMGVKTGRPLSSTTREEQVRECRERYVANVLEFGEEEREAIRQIVEAVFPFLHERYLLFASLPWSFLKITERIEGGLPHTRGRHIILSSRQTERLAAVFSKETRSSFQALLPHAVLLIHEQFHVFQRLHPDLFLELYEEIWGFRHVPTIQTHPDLDRLHVVNPDATDCNWVMPLGRSLRKRIIQPFLCFTNEVPERALRMPQHFVLLAVELEEGEEGYRVRTDPDGRPHVSPLLAETEYRYRFGGSTHIYHPHEASADLFATLVATEIQIQQHELSQEVLNRLPPSLRAFRAWVQKRLGSNSQ